LVVDDSSAQRKLISHALKATGLCVDVRLADCAEMAMELIRLSSYSMVFTDFDLSGDASMLDGSDLVKLIRASPEGQGIVLIGLSSTITKCASAFMDAGTNATLPKPLPSKHELTEIIKALHTQRDTAALMISALHAIESSSIRKSIQVLLVEDSTAQAKLMSRRLQEVGTLLSTHFDIMICSSAEAAMDAFCLNVDAHTGKSRFDFAVIDQQLSDIEGHMRGADLIRALRSNDACTSSMLLFGCSNNFKVNAAILLDAGGNYVFPKPLPSGVAMAATLKQFALFA